jgi:hypothetical protein
MVFYREFRVQFLRPHQNFDRVGCKFQGRASDRNESLTVAIPAIATVGILKPKSTSAEVASESVGLTSSAIL